MDQILAHHPNTVHVLVAGIVSVGVEREAVFHILAVVEVVVMNESGIEVEGPGIEAVTLWTAPL